VWRYIGTMKHTITASVIVGVCIVLAGLSVCRGLHDISAKDRAVSVKGLATREVKADYAVWPLSFTISGNNLKGLYAREAELAKSLGEQLQAKGFTQEDIRHGKISVSDNWENYYGQRPLNQYTLTSSVVVSTANVDLVVANQDCVNEFASEGVIIHSYDWQLDYQFNGLTEIKPEMIQEATKNARVVAQKFADDAECSLGSIRHANQGQFSIESDQYQPWMKHIRVVTTIDYYLR